MAITLRRTATDTTGKSTELTYQEMNDNLKSYYFSSSLNGSTLELYTTGSDTHSIDLSSFNQTDITSLNNFTGSIQIEVDNLTAETSSYLVADDTGSLLSGDDTGSFYYSSSAVLNTVTFFQGDGTTESVYIDTGSVNPDPAGSDTQVQFNDGGTLAGDTNLTWNKTGNYLTVIGNINSPALRLSSSLAAQSAGQGLGEFVIYSGVSDSEVGGIAWKSDKTFSNNDVPTRVEVSTTPDNTETPTVKLTIFNDGKTQLNEYGSGNFTGTAAKDLAVDSSGNIIEKDTIVRGSNIAVSYDTYLNSLLFSINNVGTSITAPTTNGEVSVRYVGSNTAANVDRIDVFKTDSGGTDQSNTLENLAVSGSISTTQVGGGSRSEVYRILSVTDNTTYMSYTVEHASGDNLAVLIGATDTFTFDSDYEYELSVGYNRLTVTNNSNNASQRFRMVAPSSAIAGQEVVVEITAGSGQDIQPAYQVRNGTASQRKIRRVYEVDGATVSQVLLDAADVVVMRFQVNVVGSVTGLTLLGANQIIYA